ncbi:MAG: Gfo/Idh/MocA family oxidoreductase [Lentisphaeria bacterium]|nr:Gfo/Idh/MocA family oxidoreductase [Lentisphaeria bacterium]
MSDTVIRTAILGYGRNGSTMHAGCVEKSPEFTMSAVCDVDSAARDKAKSRFDCSVYEDYREMLADEELDLVVIVTRSDQHCEMVCDCLDAGVNVLVTKPWATNREEAARLVAKSRTSKGHLLPWLPVRWASDYLRLRELLAEEAIGKVFLIRRCCTSFGMRDDWQTETKFGGGYVLNWGPHIVDPAMLLGGAPVATVYGQTRKAINPGDAEDLFMAMITLEDGTLLHTEYSVCVSHLPNWFVQGTRGTIVAHGSKLTIHKHVPHLPEDPTQYAAMRGDEDEVIEEALEGHVYGDVDAVYGDVAAALAGERPFPVSPDDAYGLSVTLDAIKQSQEGDCIVRPDYTPVA